MPIPKTTQPKQGDTVAISLMKINMLLGGTPALGDNAERSARKIVADLASGGGGPGSGPNAAQVSVYDDFIVVPGLWGNLGGGLTYPTPTGAQNGIVNIPPGSYLVRALGKTNGTYSLPYGNISKIVFRVVFLMTSVALTGFNEIVLGFTHTGNNTADASNNLYGAFLNFCPGYGNTLPDWNTRALLTTAQLTGFTYGLYNGSAGSGLPGFGYKPSSLIPAPLANTWYEGIISMVPGVSCAFYIGPYGSAVLDQTCTVAAQVPALMTAGPQITMGSGTGIPSSIQIDKCQYAVWFKEGNKTLTDNQMYSM